MPDRHGALRELARPQGRAGRPTASAPRRYGRLVLGIAFLSWGCGGTGERGAGPSVLLVTIDTLRADHCSSYGYRRPTTPRLDRLAAEGVRFDQAYAPTATTSPSHATAFTGLHPKSHGVLMNGQELDAGFETLAEALRRAGYATAAVVGSYAVHSRFGLAQGFDHYDDAFDPEQATITTARWEGVPVPEGFDRRAGETTRRAIRWLEAARGDERPFFLWVHYFDPHTPYVAPAPHRGVFAAGSSSRERRVSAYDEEIRYTDTELGRLVDAVDSLGLGGTTLLLVTADHGEGLGDHGWLEHGLHIYEEAVRVPMVARWPGRIAAGRVVSAPVSLVDLPATILESVGLEPREDQGSSLAPILRGERAGDPGRPIFFQRRRYGAASQMEYGIAGDKYGVRLGRFKYLEAPDEGVSELYDLDADPGELRNLAGERPEIAAALARTLREWSADGPSPEEGTVPDDAAERLKALGYVQ